VTHEILLGQAAVLTLSPKGHQSGLGLGTLTAFPSTPTNINKFAVPGGEHLDLVIVHNDHKDEVRGRDLLLVYALQKFSVISPRSERRSER